MEQVLDGQMNADIPTNQIKNVPENVWRDRFHCVEYNACVKQNGSNFSYIPLNDLKTYKGPLIQWNSRPDVWQANKLICESKVPNFLNRLIPVKTQLDS